MPERPRVLDLLARDLYPGDLLSEGERIAMTHTHSPGQWIDVIVVSANVPTPWPEAWVEHSQTVMPMLRPGIDSERRRYAYSDEVRVIRRQQ